MTLLEIKQLTKRDGNATLFAPVDLHIEQGQCVVVQCRSELGNLFLHVLLTFNPSLGGEIRLDGNMLVSQQSIQQAQKIVGVMFLDDGIYERLKVKEYLLFFKRLYVGKETNAEPTSDIDAIMRQIGLWDKQDTPGYRLSVSEKRRLQVGRCLVHNPELVIMEDPEHNIDLESRIIIRNVIHQLQSQGKAVLITTSLVEDAISISDHVYRLDENGLKKMERAADSEENTEADEHAEFYNLVPFMILELHSPLKW